MNSSILQLLIFFWLTFFIEFIITLIFIRKKPLQILLYVFLINLFTWPLANLAYSIGVYFFLVEALVIIVEGFLIMLLFKLKPIKSFLISIVANVITASMTYLFS